MPLSDYVTIERAGKGGYKAYDARTGAFIADGSTAAIARENALRVAFDAIARVGDVHLATIDAGRVLVVSGGLHDGIRSEVYTVGSRWTGFSSLESRNGQALDDWTAMRAAALR
ncbi:MAG: hypothetical protein IPK63_15535 [Candidatus Competibacteraceae bacterium]|nr:hypothetical protein [Candidatus Competibacteraceae bacterium]